MNITTLLNVDITRLNQSICFDIDSPKRSEDASILHPRSNAKISYYGFCLSLDQDRKNGASEMI